MHTRKELKAHKVEKGHLSCDSDAPQVGSAWSDSTRVVKVNCKTNCRKPDPTVFARPTNEENSGRNILKTKMYEHATRHNGLQSLKIKASV